MLLNSGFCTDLDESGCEGSGGFFFGLGEACPADQGTCEIPEPEGSCCFPSGTCSVVEISACANGGGEFRGVDSTCAGVDCLAGACCFGVDAAPRPMKCNATRPAEASKTLARPARPWTARPQLAPAASMAPVRNSSKPFACRSLAHSVVLVSIVAASLANNPALKTWTTTVPLISTTSCHFLQHGAHVAPAMKTSTRTERWTLPTCS